MTARVRSRAILSSKLKIRKNVIKDEMDHNGAYLCVHKLLELQYLRHCGLKLVCEGQKSVLQIVDKNGVAFVLFC